MRGLFGVSFVGGVFHSVHKQNSQETRLTELTNKGLENIQKRNLWR